MRTNIALNDSLVEQAKAISGCKTKKDAVNTALEAYVQQHNQGTLLELAGKIEFAKDYNYKAMRERRKA